MLSHKLLWSAVLGACACVPLKAYAWGERAHSLIDSTAINTLPDDGPTYLKKQVSLIADSASVPDSWRAASEPFSKMAEDPNHGWFREQSAFLKTIPRSRVAFILALYREHERLEALGSAFMFSPFQLMASASSMSAHMIYPHADRPSTGTLSPAITCGPSTGRK